MNAKWYEDYDVLQNVRLDANYNFKCTLHLIKIWSNRKSPTIRGKNQTGIEVHRTNSEQKLFIFQNIHDMRWFTH